LTIVPTALSAALVIGIGNPLRQDDGLGWYVVRALERTPTPGARLRACHQLTPELAEMVSRARRVVFVDARADGTPGAVECRRLTPASTGTAWSLSHAFDPATLLACARDLYASCPPSALVSVVGEEFDAGEGLSPRLDAVLPTVVRLVGRLLQAEHLDDA